MLTMLVLVIGPIAVLVVLLLFIVVIGIRQEPPMEELSEQASNLIATFVRRLLGLHVRKPDSPCNLDQGDGSPCPARVIPLAGLMDKPNLE